MDHNLGVLLLVDHESQITVKKNDRNPNRRLQTIQTLPCE